MRTLTQPLNMSPGGIPPVIHVSQYDSDFTIVFNLFSTVGDFTIESGTTAVVRGTKSSGTGYSADATINISAKTVTVTGNQQMTAAAGQNVFEITLYKNNKEISSKNFILLCERAALDADTITDESVLKELNAIIESADTATQAAEEAEDAADRAEAAAQSLVIDPTLTLPGQPADAKATGDAIAQIVPGLSETAKAALLACFEHVAWIDEHGQNYYDALESALYGSEPYWDYEWRATSGIAPTMMQAYTYNFTDYASENAMFVDNFYIDFNHIGNCEILFTAKSLAPSGKTNRTPQISIRGAQNTDGYNGFKIVYNTPSGKVETSASGTFEATSIDYNVYHEYRAKYENGVCYAYIDGTLVGQGSGVINNAYLYMTGIFGSAMVDGQPDISHSIPYTQMTIKEIKFKVLS